MIKHPIVIFWNKDLGEYIADIPDLKFCTASDVSLEVCLAKICTAHLNWMKAAKEAGAEIPAPSRIKNLFQARWRAVRVRKLAIRAQRKAARLRSASRSR